MPRLQADFRTFALDGDSASAREKNLPAARLATWPAGPSLRATAPRPRGRPQRTTCSKKKLGGSAPGSEKVDRSWPMILFHEAPGLQVNLRERALAGNSASARKNKVELPHGV